MNFLVRIISDWVWILTELFPPIFWKVLAIFTLIPGAMLWTGQLLSRATP